MPSQHVTAPGNERVGGPDRSETGLHAARKLWPAYLQFLRPT